VTAITLPVGEVNHMAGGVVDAANGYLYMSNRQYDYNSEVARIDLSPFSYVSAVTIGTTCVGELGADLDDGYVYVASCGGSVFPDMFQVDIDPARTFQQSGFAPLDSGDRPFFEIAVDAANNFAYLSSGGTSGTDRRVVKVNTSTLTRIGHLVITDQSGYFGGDVALDSVNGNLYYGSSQFPATISKIELTGFTVADTNTLSTQSPLNDYSSSAIDADNGYAYFGSYGSDEILKVRLSDFSILSSTPVTGATFIENILLDTAKGYGYIIVGDDPGKIIKISLGAGDAAPTTIGELELDPSEVYPIAAVIDPVNGYLYTVAETYPATVVKVALGAGASLPTRVGSLVLNAGEEEIYAAAIDVSGGYAYLVAALEPTIVVKVALGAGASLPTRVGAAAFDAGEDYGLSVGLDPTNGYGYVGTYEGDVVKFSMGAGAAAPTRVTSVNLAAPMSSVSMDTANGYAFFATADEDPGKVVRVNLGAGASAPSQSGSLDLSTGESELWTQVFDSDNGYLYVASQTDPGYIVKVSTNHHFQLEYCNETSDSCDPDEDWYAVSTDGTGHWSVSDSANLENGDPTTNVTGGPVRRWSKLCSRRGA
jgi:hypothetical protein